MNKLEIVADLKKEWYVLKMMLSAVENQSAVESVASTSFGRLSMPLSAA